LKTQRLILLTVLAAVGAGNALSAETTLRAVDYMDLPAAIDSLRPLSPPASASLLASTNRWRWLSLLETM
jgi:hypothetical protein